MLLVSVFNERQTTRLKHPSGPLEFGRFANPLAQRVVVEDRYVSRDQLRVLELPSGQLRLENIGNPITMPDGSTLAKGEIREVDLPFRIKVGYSTIDLAAEAIPEVSNSPLQTISRPMRSGAPVTEVRLDTKAAAPNSETLARWFETLLVVQRATAGSAAFYEETAHAVVDLVGLDRGLVVLRTGDTWQIAAAHVAQKQKEAGYSRSVLEQVLSQKRTFFQAPSPDERSASLMRIEAVVASPIFAANEEVVGVVYGSRDLRSGAAGTGIQPLEAQLVQLLAGAVSAGLARMDKEREAARMRVQFEQFFSPELARELEHNRQLLEGQEREITVLFADLRGFSKISERLGARDTYRLMGDVMDRLTAAIMERGGVIIDYYGDGLAAMWNAPTDQADHATRACEAALAMQAELPALNEKWEQTIGAALRIGVGIHTGKALVGNAGSGKRMKYGPRGHTVNLASRIEGATKQLGVPVLISETTQALVDRRLESRQLCQVRAVGVEGTVKLHELCGPEPSSDWLAQREAYTQALVLFESGESSAAIPVLERLLEASAHDGPALLLLERARKALSATEPFDPVWKMDSK